MPDGGPDERQRQYGRLFPVARALLVPIFRTGWRTHLRGVGNLPTDGPAIICPNHTSVIDSFLLPSVLPRRISFVGKAEYLDDWKTRHLFPALGMIPIDRKGGDASARALDAAAGVLERGDLFGIYPEGTRSRDGKLRKGHTGPPVWRCAPAPRSCPWASSAPATSSRRARAPRPFHPCEIRIGRPIDPAHRSDDRLVLRQLTDELMYEIRELSRQEYVDEYATRAHDAVPSQPTAIVLPHGNGSGAAAGHGLARAGATAS